MTEQKTMSMKFDDTGIAPEVLIDAVNFMYGLDLSVGITNCAGLLDIAERFVMDDLKREASKHFAQGLKLALIDMPNSNRFDILSISIFSEISLSISISISIFSKNSLSISISIYSRTALSISISIFSW